MRKILLGVAAAGTLMSATAAQATVFHVDVTYWDGIGPPPADPTSDNVARFTFDDTDEEWISDGARYNATGSFFDFPADGAIVDFYDADHYGGINIIPYLNDGPDSIDVEWDYSVGTMGAALFTGDNDHPRVRTGVFDQLWYFGDASDGMFHIVISADADAAPEPVSWAMMVGGFGAVGGAMRRRRPAIRFG